MCLWSTSKAQLGSRAAHCLLIDGLFQKLRYMYVRDCCVWELKQSGLNLVLDLSELCFCYVILSFGFLCLVQVGMEVESDNSITWITDPVLLVLVGNMRIERHSESLVKERECWSLFRVVSTFDCNATWALFKPQKLSSLFFIFESVFPLDGV